MTRARGRGTIVGRSGRRIGGAAAATVIAVIGAAQPAAAVDPHRSFDTLVSSNGFGVVTYDLARARGTGFLEHVYRFPTREGAATQTRDFCYDTYFGLRVGSEATWLTEVPIGEDEPPFPVVGPVLRGVAQWFRGVQVTTFFFAPWDHPGPALAMIAYVTSVSGTGGEPVSLFSLHNFHVGSGRPEPGVDGERIVWDAASGSYAETGPAGVALVYAPVEPPARHACTPNNPYRVVPAGGDLADTDDSGTTADAVAGFQWDLGPMAAGAAEVRGVLVGFDAGGAVAAARTRLEAFEGGRDSLRILTDEARVRTDEIAASVPESLAFDERALWIRSVALILEAQVRESGRGFGQIVASLPPGQWNISWVRDMCYAIVALVRAGRFDEARDALRFMLEAEVGDYESYVGMPYRISVTRYFGDGTEESDWNADGPNIEFDGFGLFLWALGELVDAWDDPWWRPYWPAIRDDVANVLVALRDPATGLILPDSSIWEVHWNGRQKRFTYTSLAAARGLCSASSLADKMGDAERASTYREASAGIRDAILEHATDSTGALAQSREDLLAGFGYRDAAVLEALGWGLVRPDGRTGLATLDALIEYLTPPSGRGFYRNDDGGWYDSQEWVFVDLRAAEAFRLAGRAAVADDLTGWITAQASMNHYLIAELHDATTADYLGSVPMAGFGAGAYVIALAQRAAGTAAAPACGEWSDGADADGDADSGADSSADVNVDVDQDADAGGEATLDADTDAGGPNGAEGCGCRAVPRAGFGTPAWIAAVAARRRRST